MDPYIGEIKIWSLNFAPMGWAFCNGQLLSIQQNAALFSLLGTTYGGDGRTTFALPNLQGRAPMHFGEKPGLTPRSLGETGGDAQVTLLTGQMAAHTHTLKAASEANSPNANDAVLASATVEGPRGPDPFTAYTAPSTPKGMSNQAVQCQGNGQAHTNMQPYLPLNMCIAITGIYPPRE